ncbi:hypothetical protein EBI_25480 [Enterocytozoon bieneusi H348]|nr:hypothetical protein EBI_25480 [Enterocytozoon bieneusi H348]|eukprot:XP_002651221.1 hypothetical protein EBI_25480 [Enterocytozoon bieneusi H348]
MLSGKGKKFFCTTFLGGRKERPILVAFYRVFVKNRL